VVSRSCGFDFVEEESGFSFAVDRSKPVFFCLVLMDSGELHFFCSHCGVVRRLVGHTDKNFSHGFSWMDGHGLFHSVLPLPGYRPRFG
jgi:hypothetical protein